MDQDQDQVSSSDSLEESDCSQGHSGQACGRSRCRFEDRSVKGTKQWRLMGSNGSGVSGRLLRSGSTYRETTVRRHEEPKILASSHEDQGRTLGDR